ncbi:MAG TPA: hypothetical protein DCQ64_18755 [Candidatus Rokubacteria bacterium]|nr:hypothetical protein [Candidatus Rokubacteria bacterium]
MPGSLTIPNVLAGIAGPANVAASLLDANWNQIRDYVNAREIVQDTLANRPAASVAGRVYYATDTGILYADTGSAWTQIALGTLAANLAETLTGLTLSNNGADATNDLDVAVGAASSQDAVIADRNLMSLTTAITKQLDAAWAVGTNQGGRMSAAAIANTTYHVHLIKRVDTGVVDVGLDVSATAPTLPTNYTKFRRIGSILREAGAIVAFSQIGDEFLRLTPVLDVDVTNPGTAAVTRTLSVPIGIPVWALINVFMDQVASNYIVYLSALDQADVAASAAVAPLGQLGTGAAPASAAELAWGGRIRTNTSAQIRSRQSASGAGDIFRIATQGWIDRRGRG